MITKSYYADLENKELKVESMRIKEGSIRLYNYT